MLHRRIEYSLDPIKPGLWKWQFRIDGMVRAGRIKANLGLLAERKVRMRIDYALRQRSRQMQWAAE